jgi:hypothetical protein
MHALVFWGFIAFAGYSTVQFLKGPGLADFTRARWFHLYSLAVVPFAVAGIVGILALLVRRVALRPPGLGKTVSVESVDGVFIATLMVTFLLDFTLTTALRRARTGGRTRWSSLSSSSSSPVRSTCICCCRR